MKWDNPLPTGTLRRRGGNMNQLFSADKDSAEKLRGNSREAWEGRKLRQEGPIRCDIFQLTFYNTLFDGLDRYPFGSDEFHGGFNFSLFAAQQNGHNANLILHAGLPNVKYHFRKLAAHLPDDRLLQRP